jgi:hypothetical protein
VLLVSRLSPGKLIRLKDNLIGHRDFVDGTTRPICEGARGQHVLDDDGQGVYGVWLVPEEQTYDSPLIAGPASTART